MNAGGLDTQHEARAKPLLRVTDGETCFPPPIWFMRQAGRYLPEYRAIRAKASSFLEFCYTPALAAEATLQPIRRFGFDAAILFSDILVVPDALGQKVAFEPGEGPRLEPILTWQDFARLNERLDQQRLSPIFETIERVKSVLPSEVALLGFCGAPWTVACYMVAGKSVPDQAPARLLAYRQRGLFAAIISRLVEVSIDYLSSQIEAGAEAVQIFDSWAGLLPASEFEAWCIAPVAAIIEGLRKRHKGARVIGFPRGSCHSLADFAARTGINALGLDSSADPVEAAKRAPKSLALQGNLDPLALLAGGEAMNRAVTSILSALRGRPHIFNLGHGILPDTPINHVELTLRCVRQGGFP